MNQTDDSGKLLAHTMKELFPPRVELDRRQAVMLDRLSQKTGQPVQELVRQALDRYLQEVQTLDRYLEEEFQK